MAMNEPTKLAVQRCFLLELPKELRLQVYEELIPSDSILLCTFDDPSILGKPDAEVAAKCVYYNLPDAKGEGDRLGLLRTCAQIHAEAKDYVHRVRTLKVAPSRQGKFVAETHGLRLLPKGALSQLKTLEKLEVDLTSTEITVEEDCAHSAFFMRCFPIFTKAHHTQINIYDCWFAFWSMGANEGRFQSVSSLVNLWRSHLGETAHLVVSLYEDCDHVATWQLQTDRTWKTSRPAEVGHAYESSGRVERYFKVVKSAGPRSVDDRTPESV